MNDEEKNLEEETVEENNIIEDWDYSEYDYDDIIEQLEDEGWTRISPAGSITDFDSDIVLTRQVKKDSLDTFLEITCPEKNLIVICGYNQFGVDKEDFVEMPNLFSIPHFFAIRCADDDNFEISPKTIISISKINKDNEIEKLYQEFYGDLSPHISGRLKKKQERYYFAETNILQRGEKLIFKAYKPDINITKVDLFMMCDLFNKAEIKKDQESE